jgi:hypothetical protein
MYKIELYFIPARCTCHVLYISYRACSGIEILYSAEVRMRWRSIRIYRRDDTNARLNIIVCATKSSQVVNEMRMVFHQDLKLKNRILSRLLLFFAILQFCEALIVFDKLWWGVLWRVPRRQTRSKVKVIVSSRVGIDFLHPIFIGRLDIPV